MLYSCTSHMATEGIKGLYGNVSAVFASCVASGSCGCHTSSSCVDCVQLLTAWNERRPLDPAHNPYSCSVDTSPALIYKPQKYNKTR